MIFSLPFLSPYLFLSPSYHSHLYPFSEGVHLDFHRQIVVVLVVETVLPVMMILGVVFVTMALFLPLLLVGGGWHCGCSKTAHFPPAWPVHHAWDTVLGAVLVLGSESMKEE